MILDFLISSVKNQGYLYFNKNSSASIDYGLWMQDINQNVQFEDNKTEESLLDMPYIMVTKGSSWYQYDNL